MEDVALVNLYTFQKFKTTVCSVVRTRRHTNVQLHAFNESLNRLTDILGQEVLRGFIIGRKSFLDDITDNEFAELTSIRFLYTPLTSSLRFKIFKERKTCHSQLASELSACDRTSHIDDDCFNFA